MPDAAKRIAYNMILCLQHSSEYTTAVFRSSNALIWSNSEAQPLHVYAIWILHPYHQNSRIWKIRTAPQRYFPSVSYASIHTCISSYMKIPGTTSSQSRMNNWWLKSHRNRLTPVHWWSLSASDQPLAEWRWHHSDCPNARQSARWSCCAFPQSFAKLDDWISCRGKMDSTLLIGFHFPCRIAAILFAGRTDGFPTGWP